MTKSKTILVAVILIYIASINASFSSPYISETKTRLERILNGSIIEWMAYSPRPCGKSKSWRSLDGRVTQTCHTIFDGTGNERFFFGGPEIAGAPVAVSYNELYYYSIISMPYKPPYVHLSVLKWANNDQSVGVSVGNYKLIQQSYDSWRQSSKKLNDQSKFLVDISATISSSADTVHMVLKNSVNEMIYIKHNIIKNKVDYIGNVGFASDACVLVDNNEPVIFYLDFERETGESNLLAQRTYSNGQWQPRKGLLDISADYMDALKVGKAYYIICVNMNGVVMVHIDKENRTYIYDLPTEDLIGNVNLKLGWGSEGIDIYFSLDEKGIPMKRSFTFTELQSYCRSK